MLNILLPMAGRGKRFADAGYSTPKPLIPIHGKPMTKVVLDNLRPACPHRFIFLVLQEHIDAFAFDKHLQEWEPACTIIPVREVTQGAACTCLLARQYIDNDAPLMIANCDQWIDADINDYLAAMDRQNADGLIMTMHSDSPKWSYCRLDNGRITEVVEKQVVSNEATVGIYNFKHGRDFVRAADAMIRKNLRVNGSGGGEFYVAPAYNELLAEGKHLIFHNIGREDDGMHGLGIPADLEKFLALTDRGIARLMRLAKIQGRAGILEKFAQAIESSRSTYLTFHERPRTAAQIATVSDPVHDPSQVAIVLQGPIRTEDDFTLNTVQLYRRHFPHAAIILSTWDSEDPALLQKFAAADGGGAIVITRPLPAVKGYANVNCQIVSARAGIEKARDLGLPFVLKTRTDQRTYAPNALEFLRSLLQTYPLFESRSSETRPSETRPSGSVPRHTQKSRIVGLSLDTFKYRLYGVGDHLLFGTTDDLLLYWSCPLDHCQPPTGPTLTWDQTSRRNVVETYFVTEFLQKIGRPIDWTLADSFAVFADHFCIIDRESIDLFWPKYLRHKENRQLAYDHIHNTQELTFRDWSLLHAHRVDVHRIPQAFLHGPHDAAMT